ncbi:putative polyketide synthase protein [Cladorrhinum sp. PSN332]|nr:putative polyketide synthase protein [Cladorrhinum sp. PSN332]
MTSGNGINENHPLGDNQPNRIQSAGTQTNGTNEIHTNTAQTNGATTNGKGATNSPMPIAIVGMACRLPGNVSTVDDFWRLMSMARDGWCEIPKDRCFNTDAYYHPNPSKKGCVNTKAGYFLQQDPTLFDAPFFSMTRQEAEAMDPQQRMLLETTYEALETAGIPKESIVGKNVGVFVGGAPSDYHLGALRDLETIPMFDSTGNHPAILAGRISYYFDLRGPAVVLDTACSSSLYALHSAVQSIRSGESEQAIVAACHLNFQPDDWVSMSMGHLFSDSGRTHAFDNRAKGGFVRGEGAGALILKPLDQAIKDNDKIRAVIRNSGTNQDGRSAGITSPNGKAQEQLMRDVYAGAGISIDEVGFVEAHGTGTKVGDPIEATAIYNVFGKNRPKTNPNGRRASPLYVGSVKSNIGHLENASGIMSVIKAALMLERGFILPNVPTGQRPWPQDKKYISCNNFGFGGSNAHCVLERAPLPPAPSASFIQTPTSAEPQQRIFTLSANDEAAAKRLIRQLVVFLEEHPEMFQTTVIRNLAYTLCQRRSHLPWRVALVGASTNDLVGAINRVDIKPVRALSYAPKLGFAYTGQGAQWYGMGRELLQAYPVFADTIRESDACLKRLGADFSLLEELLRGKASSRVDKAHISQPICTAVQVGLTNLLSSWGIRPESVVGHSSGEVGAAYAAGALTLESAMAVAYYRGQAILQLPEKCPDLRGSMMAVGAGPEEIRPLLKLLRSGVANIACENSPGSVTVSGDEPAIDELATIVEAKQLFHRKLRVDFAYHSKHMNFIAQTYNNALRKVEIKPVDNGVEFFSSLHGRQVDISTIDASYWVDNLTCPVLFYSASRALLLKGGEHGAPDFLVEVGPHAALQGPIKQVLKGITGKSATATYLPTLVRGKDATTTMIELAAALYAKGQDLNHAAINREDQPQPTPPTLYADLSPYPWSYQKYWLESRITREHRTKPFQRHDLLGTLMATSNKELYPVWRNILSIDDVPWLVDHQMSSLVTFPFAGFLCMAVEAAAQRAHLRGAKAPADNFMFREVQVRRPLVLRDGCDYEVMLSMMPYAEGTRAYSDDWDEFRICSYDKEKGWTEHCRGQISITRGKTAKVGSNVVKFRQGEKLCLEGVDTGKFYKELQEMGAIYGPAFQKLRDIRVGDETAVAVVDVVDTEPEMPLHHQSPFIIHPSVLDQILQMTYAVLGAGRGILETIYLPTLIKELHLAPAACSLKPGDTLHAITRGIPPDAGAPRPISFTKYVMSSPNDDEPIMSFLETQMQPVRGDSSSDSAPRDLCFKLEWETHEVNEEIEKPLRDIPVTIISDRAPHDSLLVSLVQGLLEQTGRVPSIQALARWADNAAANEIYIVLTELDQPLISNFTEESFSQVQQLLLRSSGTLWVTSGAYKFCTNPDANMASGLLRALRSEMAAIAAMLDLDPDSALSSKERSSLIVQALEGMLSGENADMEYAEQDGALVVPRVADDEGTNLFVHRELNPKVPYLHDYDPAKEERRLTFAIETPGALDTLYFADSTERPLREREIEVKVAATGMNFKDVVISMGQLASPYIGVECSGTVSRVGSAVTSLTVGDRVCAMSEGAYGTYAYCAATSAARIPDSMSFELAASIPVVYCTAHYSLIELARLSAGEKVLIHAAAGGVGQAAIQLAHMVGAEVFATVGSPDKKKWIMEQYGIPDNRIFSSRDGSFGPAIRKVTEGAGVDVVLNSLAGDLLKETWDCLAAFGRFIEIGKRDITNNTRLEMAKFDSNVTFASVDLTLVAAARPQMMDRTLTAVMSLMDSERVRPISPITVFSLSDVEKAFRLLQSGKTMGKLVVVPKYGEANQIRATHPTSNKATASKSLREDATYLIVGGTGGLGRSLAEWMVAQGGKNIVLLSRSGRVEGPLAELVRDLNQKAGANVLVRACDVGDRKSVQKLVVEIVADGLPPIRGVIQAGMVLRDSLFEKMSWKDYQDVIRSKVAGTWNVHNALLASRLDFFIALSSVAGIVGNRGQAAYAAANTFLDAFARYRHRLGLPATSIDLTAVQDVGHLAEADAERKAQILQNFGGPSAGIFEAEVLALIQAGILGKLKTWCNDCCVTGVGLYDGSAGADPDNLPYFAVDAKFRHLRDAIISTPSGSVDSAGSDDDANVPNHSVAYVSNAIRSASTPEKLLEVVTAGLAAKLAAIIMIPVSDIDSSRSVTDYGLDSLNTIEMRNWVTKAIGANLQVLELLTAGSLTNLAALVLKKRETQVGK